MTHFKPNYGMSSETLKYIPFPMLHTIGIEARSINVYCLVYFTELWICTAQRINSIRSLVVNMPDEQRQT
jgi:hypothetical protein